MSLRWKVALSLAALAATATFAIGIASYRTTSDRLYAEIDRSLAELNNSLRFDRIGSASRVPDRGPLAGYEMQVLRANGDVLASSLAKPFDASPAEIALANQSGYAVFRNVETEAGTLRVRTIGARGGVVQIGRSLTETDRVLSSLLSRMWRLMTLVSTIALGLGWLIAGRVTASLRRLTGAAEMVEATGRLDIAVPAKGSDEVGRLAHAMQGMLAALQRSRDDQRRLVEDAGHELRTPLTSIRTNLNVLRRYGDLSAADRRVLVDDLTVETEELVDLVNEIVAIASGAADDDPREPFDLGVLAREVAERYERRTGRTVIVHSDRSPVQAQRAALQRAISNLLDNARKFDTGDGPLEVNVAAGSVEVSDRGPGIPEGDLPLVFDRFHRSDDVWAMPGSGLGLSIVHDVAERHGGTAWARNRDGGGAVVGFSVTT